MSCRSQFKKTTYGSETGSNNDIERDTRVDKLSRFAEKIMPAKRAL
ncbi:MAG: hypothetical protein AAGL17_23025 [Cyanobacteria bacterium J06576_12]